MDIKTQIISSLKTASDAILRMAERLDEAAVERAFELIRNSEGKVVLKGVGKAASSPEKYPLPWPAQAPHPSFSMLRKAYTEIWA